MTAPLPDSHGAPFFSVVVPLRDGADHVEACLSSIIAASASVPEIIVIDDGSQDDGLAVAERVLRDVAGAQLLKNSGPRGPGAARNAGVDAARGQWVLFVDADDVLVPGALDLLRPTLQDGTSDIVFFDWDDHHDSLEERQSTRNFGRRDFDDLEGLGNDEIALNYLRFLIDPSAIYTAVRRSFVARNAITFRPGLHEDFDFTLECLLRSSGHRALREVLYLKKARAGSVVHSISPDHLEGFARAWRRSLQLCAEVLHRSGQAGQRAVRAGKVALIATRAREIIRHSESAEDASLLMATLFDVLGPELDDLNDLADPWTVYERLACRVRDARLRGDSSGVLDEISDLDGVSWSCVDLQNSLFLRPDEVRTCCKRFFVGGSMRGDVALMRVVDGCPPSPAEVLSAKRSLHRAINAGKETPCSGCPFLRMSDWDPLGRLDVSYLSMEQHSVCNLRCTYCSEEYFGGKKPEYDVRGFLEALAHNGALEGCHTVVWGGGEPTVAQDFAEMVSSIQTAAPQANQRFLTNATKFSEAVGAMLAKGHAQVITSIDAGTAATFASIRGRNRLSAVVDTLAEYSAINPGRVTIKYIFTDGNDSLGDVSEFVGLIARSEPLVNCCFQISADFKTESISPSALQSAIQMYSGLVSIGAAAVYFDELLRQRLIGEDREALIASAANLGWPLALADPGAYDRVAIWGAGQLTGLLLETAFMQDVPIAHIVDSVPTNQGTRLAGLVVEDPEVVIESEVPVVLSAVQGLPLLLEDAKRRGLGADRVVRDLVL